MHRTHLPPPPPPPPHKPPPLRLWHGQKGFSLMRAKRPRVRHHRSNQTRSKLYGSVSDLYSFMPTSYQRLSSRRESFKAIQIRTLLRSRRAQRERIVAKRSMEGGVSFSFRLRYAIVNVK
jgi:hypothetical protein